MTEPQEHQLRVEARRLFGVCAVIVVTCVVMSKGNALRQAKWGYLFLDALAIVLGYFGGAFLGFIPLAILTIQKAEDKK